MLDRLVEVQDQQLGLYIIFRMSTNSAYHLCLSAMDTPNHPSGPRIQVSCCERLRNTYGWSSSRGLQQVKVSHDVTKVQDLLIQIDKVAQVFAILKGPKFHSAVIRAAVNYERIEDENPTANLVM